MCTQTQAKPKIYMRYGVGLNTPIVKRYWKGGASDVGRAEEVHARFYVEYLSCGHTVQHVVRPHESPPSAIVRPCEPCQFDAQFTRRTWAPPPLTDAQFDAALQLLFALVDREPWLRPEDFETNRHSPIEIVGIPKNHHWLKALCGISEYADHNNIDEWFDANRSNLPDQTEPSQRDIEHHQQCVIAMCRIIETVGSNNYIGMNTYNAMVRYAEKKLGLIDFSQPPVVKS